jgi:hypothetical protein
LVLYLVVSSQIASVGDGASTVCKLPSSLEPVLKPPSVNLPFGALAILSVVLFLHSEGALQTEEIKKMTIKQKILT